jgi:hypothetical protein
MSIDLSIRSTKPFQLPSQLPNSRAWIRHANEWQFDATEWLVSVLPASRSGHDQPDPAVLEKVPGAAHPFGTPYRHHEGQFE